MSTAQTITNVSRKLESFLGKAAFPALHKRLGTQLLAKLQQAVQVTVIGLPGSGKTSVINMLLGWSAIPSIPQARVVDVVYGPQPRTLIEYEDGTIDEMPGVIEEAAFTRPALRVTLELPEDHLLSQSYTEVSLSGSDAEIETLLRDVSETSALVIWCSDTVTDHEQALWRTMPDHIKDHSFLVLTMADRHQMKGTLAQRINELEDFVAQEFYGLYPIAILQALKARTGASTEHPQLWALSGGKALSDAIDQQVTLGRAEDLDRAQVLLDAVKSDPPTAQTPDDHAKHQSADPSGPDPEAHCALEDKTKTKTKTGSADMALKQAMQDLETSAQALAEDLKQGAPDISDLISKCLATAQGLSETFASVSEHDRVVEGLLQDTQQGESMLLLLQLEDDEDAATDAVSLMVQLKKEIAAKACA
ncbi:MAG: hypothetical protein AAFN44_01820 [Pseudomonadota bacterium]